MDCSALGFCPTISRVPKLQLAMSEGAHLAQCARSATIWASGHTLLLVCLMHALLFFSVFALAGSLFLSLLPVFFTLFLSSCLLARTVCFSALWTVLYFSFCFTNMVLFLSLWAPFGRLFSLGPLSWSPSLPIRQNIRRLESIECCLHSLGLHPTTVYRGRTQMFVSQ
jgi:hypothetical protein